MPAHLPRYEVTLEAPAEITHCPTHGPRKPIGYDCRQTLEKLHIFSSAARFRVPMLARPMAEVALMALDHRAGFLLSLLEAARGSNVEDLLTMCPMPEAEVLEILFGLVRAGAVKMQ